MTPAGGRPMSVGGATEDGAAQSYREVNMQRYREVNMQRVVDLVRAEGVSAEIMRAGSDCWVIHAGPTRYEDGFGYACPSAAPMPAPSWELTDPDRASCPALAA